MSKRVFQYQAFLKEEGSAEVSSLTAYSDPLGGPFEAVIWDATREAWVYAPRVAFGLLYDDDPFDQIYSTAVERGVAERLARDYLHSELPSDDVLEAMIEEGKQRGWDYGPPRS